MKSCPCMAKESDQGVEHRGQAGVEPDLSPIESVWALMDWQIKLSSIDTPKFRVCARVFKTLES